MCVRDAFLDSCDVSGICSIAGLPFSEADYISAGEGPPRHTAGSGIRVSAWDGRLC